MSHLEAKAKNQPVSSLGASSYHISVSHAIISSIYLRQKAQNTNRRIKFHPLASPFSNGIEFQEQQTLYILKLFLFLSLDHLEKYFLDSWCCKISRLSILMFKQTIFAFKKKKKFVFHYFSLLISCLMFPPTFDLWQYGKFILSCSLNSFSSSHILQHFELLVMPLLTPSS